jgi:hypothetical protein
MDDLSLSPQERAALSACWIALCTFLSLWYLTQSFWRSALVALFALISMALNFGSQWVSRVGFALSILAIALFLGAPTLDRWADLIKSASELITQFRSAVL